MTDFARRVGLLGLLTFASSMGIAIALEMAHVHPKTILLGNGLPVSLPPIAWLCLLPLCGAAGALVSHRSGGSRLQRIAACLFPGAIMAAVLLIIFGRRFRHIAVCAGLRMELGAINRNMSFQSFLSPIPAFR